MPFTPGPIGDYIVAAELESNFQDLQDLLRSGLVRSDLLGSFKRWKLSRLAGRRLAQVMVLSEPRTADGAMGVARYKFDMSYRDAGKDPTPARFSADVETLVQVGPWDSYAMELLGRPGPSFHMEFQEDGQAEPTGAVGWPPSYWPINRYPSEYCYSRWLTVPGATVRVYIPESCVVRISGSCIGALNKFRVDTCSSVNVVSFGSDNARGNERRFHVSRFALIVDTNPQLFDDEFVNSNPNVLDPLTGAMADYCSWKIIEEEPLYLPQRAVVRLAGEVALVGGRYYNFRMVYRDAMHHGWVDMSGGAPGTFRNDVWEASFADYPLSPNRLVYEPANWQAIHLAVRGLQYERCFYPSWLNLWEGSHLALTADYGRSETYLDDATDNDLASRST